MENMRQQSEKWRVFVSFWGDGEWRGYFLICSMLLRIYC